MKVNDLIELLNNRVREFKLSRDYAKMSGNLERMNAADKEVIALEDTIYQLGLLVDKSKSAAVKEETLTEAITDGSVAVLGEYDITSYATDPQHEEKIMKILSNMGVMDTAEKIESYIRGKYLSSPVTGEMVMSAALAYEVDQRLMMAIMEQDSRFGTAGLAVGTLNPGNVGNDDDGNTRTYGSWQEGVTAVAEWLSRHRGSTPLPEPEEEPTATTTPAFTIPTATTTPVITTSTTTTVTNIPVTASTTPVTSTSTPSTATTTPITATTTPVTATSTSATATSTPVTSTTTPATASSTPTTSTSTATSTSTPYTSTTTPATATATATSTSEQ